MKALLILLLVLSSSVQASQFRPNTAEKDKIPPASAPWNGRYLLITGLDQSGTLSLKGAFGICSASTPKAGINIAPVRGEKAYTDAEDYYIIPLRYPPVYPIVCLQTDKGWSLSANIGDAGTYTLTLPAGIGWTLTDTQSGKTTSGTGSKTFSL